MYANIHASYTFISFLLSAWSKCQWVSTGEGGNVCLQLQRETLELNPLLSKYSYNPIHMSITYSNRLKVDIKSHPVLNIYCKFILPTEIRYIFIALVKAVLIFSGMWFTIKCHTVFPEFKSNFCDLFFLHRNFKLWSTQSLNQAEVSQREFKPLDIYDQ